MRQCGMIRKLLLALALVAAPAALLDISPAAAATDCSASSGLGDRVCVDPTTGFGPVVYIYTPGNTLWNTFPVTLNNWTGLTASTANQSQWYSVPGGIAAASCCGGVYVGSQVSGSPVAYTNNATYIGWVQWFTYDPSYPNMEFVIAT